MDVQVVKNGFFPMVGKNPVTIVIWLSHVLLAERGVVMHMLLTEYDEKKHLKNTFREGWEEGERIGWYALFR